MVTASDRSAVSFSLSSGARHDSLEGMNNLPLYMTLAAAALILDVSLRYARKRREQWQE